MVQKRFPIFMLLALVAGTLCGAGPVLAQGKTPRAEAAHVRVLHCADVVCSAPGMGAARGQLALSAHYPQLAGRALRVVVVDEANKQVSLIDVRSDVAASGDFRVDLPVHLLGRGTYGIGVLAGSRFLADGRIQVMAAARPALPRTLQARAPGASRVSAAGTASHG